jgi:hypothetical protein
MDKQEAKNFYTMRMRCRYNNFRKIICILPEDGSTEPKHVTIKGTSSYKGLYK